MILYVWQNFNKKLFLIRKMFNTDDLVLLFHKICLN